MKTETFKLSQWGQRRIMDFAGKPGLDRRYAIEIVDQLNKEPVSPWYGRINARKSGPEVATNPKQANAKALFDHLTEKLWLADA